MAPALSLRLAATALFALSASAQSLSSSLDSLLHRTVDDVLNRPYAALLTTESLSERDGQNSTADQAPAGEIPLNKDGSMNMTAWNMNTNSACRTALGGLHKSTNPSGTCLCYNLPSLDMKTGVFEADLRLYQVSQARGSFASVAPEDINVGISFNGASVMPVQPNDVNGTGLVGKKPSMSKRADGGMELLRSYMLVGRINADKMTGNMTMDELESHLMPILTLTARNSSGAMIRTNVSVNEAAFLTGVFSQDVVLGDFAMAQAAVDEQIAALNNGTVAFILPGVELMVFPIGLIITSIWLLAFVIAVGFGTYERYNYALMYQRRQAVTMPRKATI
ncbi:hypothetical protein FVEN_g554 [Fusarium venenatum]|uniref:Uncharacterized protein n=1 Tax=Fusarium venenatum TaxID=56646 RepID=A0A2L2TSJ7_9HYPO|nr:uncharacterized protein FVRRES_07311 [Fusarium venenatum]KAG8361902.1 hypothetical protein FVEN_g554 [Fusarium venenatum]KAH6994238.1 hypothetical protein EDB82DRAFT_187777 [Fusarium venenatum]CEI62875.1 unnamed protein product [Fusarium venenatum]